MTLPAQDDEVTLEDIRYRKAEIEATLACKKLYFFCRKFWSVVEPEHKFVGNWHIEEMCEVLEQLTFGTLRNPDGTICKKVIFNIPPSTMKSLIVSVFWPAWAWIHRPTLKYMTASYAETFSLRDADRMMKVVNHPFYVEWFGVRLVSNAVSEFENDHGGSRFSTSVGGAGTGLHPDVIVVDDPTKAKEALSEAEREKANTWNDSTIATRGIARDVIQVLIMQRLHERDLTGHLAGNDNEPGRWEKGTFVHVVFPMRFDKKRADPRDRRTIDGELLWPVLLGESKVRALELQLQELAPAQLQQNPVPPGGTLFKREWFKVLAKCSNGVYSCIELGEHLRSECDPIAHKPGRDVRGWDTAATENGGDHTAGVKMSRLYEDDLIIIRHVIRGQWGPGNVDKIMQETAAIDGQYCAQREEKEPGSSGKTVIEAREQTLSGYDYAGVQVDKDKITRSRPFRSHCDKGKVYLEPGEWNYPFIDELCKFPYGANDDQVDGSSCAFNAFSTIQQAVRQVEIAI
jgi:predicted phage terminase large subunit-like protein